MDIKGFKLFLVDETDCWHEDIVKAAGQKIFGAYIAYDPKALVHICSFTPSLESSFVCNYFHNSVADRLSYDEMEELHDAVFMPQSYNEIGEYTYFSESMKDKAISLDEILIGVDEEWFNEIGVSPDSAYDEDGSIFPHVIAQLLYHWDSTSGTVQNFIAEKFGSLVSDAGDN